MFSETDHPLHLLLDIAYDFNKMIELLEKGIDVNLKMGPLGETPLHVAVRRRRKEVVEILLRYGADINSKTEGGKTAYAHAIRRGFFEISHLLKRLGADITLNEADELAVALISKQLNRAREIIKAHPELVPAMKPEEARILPDLAGRYMPEEIALLLEANVDKSARGLDGGTALHQAAWFGQPEMAAILIKYGAPLDTLCISHQSTPLGWGAHGSVYSGGAKERAKEYVALTQLLLEAGASLSHPLDPSQDATGEWLLKECSEGVADVIRKYVNRQ